MDGSDTNPKREPAFDAWPGGAADDEQGNGSPAERQQRIFEPVSFEPVSFEPVSAEPVSLEPVSAEPISADPPSADPPVSDAPDLSALGGRSARSAYVPRGAYQPPAEPITWTPADPPPAPLPDDDWTPPAEWTPPEWTPPEDIAPAAEPETVAWQRDTAAPSTVDGSPWGPPPAESASVGDAEPSPAAADQEALPSEDFSTSAGDVVPAFLGTAHDDLAIPIDTRFDAPVDDAPVDASPADPLDGRRDTRPEARLDRPSEDRLDAPPVSEPLPGRFAAGPVSQEQPQPADPFPFVAEAPSAPSEPAIEPESSELGAFQPGAFQPGGFQPGAFQPAGFDAGGFEAAPDPVEPESIPLASQAVEPEAVEPQAVALQPLESHPLDSRPVESQPVDAQWAEPPAVEPEPVALQSPEPGAVELEPVAPQAVEYQVVEPQAVVPEAVEYQVVEPQAVVPQAVEPQFVEARVVDPERDAAEQDAPEAQPASFVEAPSFVSPLVAPPFGLSQPATELDTEPGQSPQSEGIDSVGPVSAGIESAGPESEDIQSVAYAIAEVRPAPSDLEALASRVPEAPLTHAQAVDDHTVALDDPAPEPLAPESATSGPSVLAPRAEEPSIVESSFVDSPPVEASFVAPGFAAVSEPQQPTPVGQALASEPDLDAWAPVEAEVVEPQPIQAAWVGSDIIDAEAVEPDPEPAPSIADPAPDPDPEPVAAHPVGVSVASQGDEYPDPLPAPNGWREVGFDTVIRAAHTPWEHQPYAELGLQEDEYAKIRQLLDRRPTESELAMYAVMWSEHCSYKSSKVHLRQFGEKAPPSDKVLAGIGENAGVVKISDKLAVTFKVESHNHPSFVEPHQGAATGVGGIVRDILAMGARPIAVMDPLRFGAADHEDTKRVLPGVVSGISNYGNSLGLPNIGGEVVFDACYQGNPLVNALCVGVLPVDRLQNKAAAGAGNVVVLIGAKTGRDGIGGVSVLASATFDEGGEKRRPSVQVGDPFVEKLLIEACLEIYDLNLVVGIQDLGGAGLTCALSETAAAAGTGMAVNLDLVPLREASMTPHEVLSSESQERMLLIVTPENLPVVLSLCARWGVLATAIGEVTPAEESGGRLRIWWRGDVVVDVPPGSLADDGPIYARPMREPNDRELMAFDRAETLARPETAAELRETMLRLAGSPNLCDKSWVTEQYDRYVLGNTVLAQPEDAGLLRLDEQTGLGVALSVDGNSRYARLDPYNGARLALAEAYRNVAVTGAVPVAVTNCLNFGSPEDPGVMWQFAEAVRGLADGCLELGIPVTGGNVSFYNQTGGAAIHPTPVVGVLGVIDNVAMRVPMGFAIPGDQVFLLGETKEELGGSEWAHVTHKHLGGAPPSVDLGAEQRLAVLMAEAGRGGLLTAAHDLSEGGLSQALVEACLRRNVGALINLPAGQDWFVQLFAESTARVIVSVRQGQERAFTALANERGVPCTALGNVQANPALTIDGVFDISLDELRAVHTATLPALFS